MKTNINCLLYLAHFFLLWEMFQRNVEKIKTRILCSIFFSENRAVYKIIWKNIVERRRTQMTIWRMRIVCWIPKATNTHRLCNTYCFSITTVVARTCLIVNVIRTLRVLLSIVVTAWSLFGDLVAKILFLVFVLIVAVSATSLVTFFNKPW